MPGAVIVFGASRGLGRAIAVAASDEGFDLVVACRRLSDGEAIAEQLAMRSRRALAVEVDVTRYDAVSAAVATARDFGNGLAGIVNNAGIIGPLAELGDTDPTAWARTIEVNLIGAYHGVHAALPHLSDGGVIVNLSSGAAHTVIPGWSAYAASKAGLAMLTRNIAAEHGARLRVYGVQPGMVDTDMQAEIRASGMGAPSRVARRNLDAVDPVARAVAWLLRHAPADLSGTEVDLQARELRLRIGSDTRRPAIN